MQESFLIYHNPKCSKSRETLSLLEGHGIIPQIKEYLVEGVTKNELKTLLSKLNLKAKDIVRTKEDLFKELDLSEADEETLLQGIQENPSLLERPIVVKGMKAVIGRPPENVLKLM